MDRNEQIMAWRREQYQASIEAMRAVHLDWWDRMWTTPDVAMCLGRR